MEFFQACGRFFARSRIFLLSTSENVKKKKSKKTLFPQKFLKDKLNAVSRTLLEKVDRSPSFPVRDSKTIDKIFLQKRSFSSEFFHKRVECSFGNPAKKFVENGRNYHSRIKKYREKIIFSKKRLYSNCSHGRGEGRFHIPAKTKKTLWQRTDFFRSMFESDGKNKDFQKR